MVDVLYWSLAIIPSLVYPAVSFVYRRKLAYKLYNINDILDRANAADLYETTYGRKAISKLFELNYHWRAYVLPVSINMLLTVGTVTVILIRTGIGMGVPRELQLLISGVPIAVIAGMAGAFVWGLYDIMDRYRAIDLTPTSFHFIWLRLVVASLMGALVGQTFESPIDLLAAFGLGAFPVKTLRDLVKERAKKKFGITAKPIDAAPANLEKIQGLTADTIDRLSDEGLDSTEHLAYADPINLLLRTNFEWKVILDIIDQSLLFIYVGDKMDKLRPLGIRGAIELAEIGSRLTDSDEAARDQAEKMVKLIATNLDQTQIDGVKNLMGTLIEDPQVDFVWRLWGETT